jgi:uncharacterized protein (TIGR03435 family)
VAFGASGEAVIGRTGLTAKYDFDLAWKTDDAETSTQEASLFAAIQEQLGLKLRAANAPVELFVIDSVERAVRKLTYFAASNRFSLFTPLNAAIL